MMSDKKTKQDGDSLVKKLLSSTSHGLWSH